MRSSLGSSERRALLAVLDVHSVDSLGVRTIDWPALVEVARPAKLLPALARRAFVAPLTIEDAAVREVLQRALEENVALSRRLLVELARTSRVLRAAGIEHVALKGVVLIARDYPHPALRQASDLDLLVDPERLDDAVCALHDAGYVDAPTARRLAPDGRTEAQTLPPGTHGWIPLIGPSGAELDLHHRVPASGFAATGGFHAWRERAQVTVVEGEPVPLCHPHDLALHLCERFAWQEFGDPLEIPRLLCDLRAAFRTAPPWSELEAKSRRSRLALGWARALYEAAYGEHGAADAVTRLLRGLAIADPAVTPLFSHASNLRGQLSRIAFDATRRPAYALRTWAPTRAYLAERYGLDPRSPRIYPLYVSRLVVAALKPLWPRG